MREIYIYISIGVFSAQNNIEKNRNRNKLTIELIFDKLFNYYYTIN